MIINASENLYSTSVPSPEFSSSSLIIDWIVPDYGIGSGGHMTIFRMIHWLEYFGHRCRIWIMSSGKLNLEHKYQEILKYYQFVKAEVFQYGDETSMAVGDVIVATSWDSAHIVSQIAGFKERFYFVQDYEPLFYGRGSRSVIAESTYELDLSCICASPWLAEVMTERHGRWAEFFYLSHDRNCYFPSADPIDNPVPRIAVYGRIGSDRRCVELSILGLAELAKRGVKFHADIFGTDENLGALPFPYTNHGILPPSDLGALYRECDLGICFSSTNYSLVPQEMMGCGLPVIELDVESTRAIFNEHIVAFAPPQTRGIADCVMALLSDHERRKRLGESGREWADTHSWEDSARRVEASMISQLQSNSKFVDNTKSVINMSDKQLKASVIIPTYNGGELLNLVVEKVLEQKCPWNFELIIVDSSSSDSSIDRLPQDDRLNLHRIAKSEFQHGRTRNLGASLGRGEYLLFLTQDALPVDEFWLYNFVSTMEHFPDAAGGFGAHLAYPNASIYNRDALKQHFKGFNDFPLCISKSYRTELWNAQDRGYVQLLHFFSDNNSCLKRSVWEKIPYAEVEYGEDQLWALEIIKQGMSKVYAPNAVVYHSHDYDYKQSFERAEIEASFFFEHFGYDFSHDDPEGEIRSRRAHATKFAARFDVPDEILEERVQQIYGEVLGHQAGAVKAKMLKSS